MVGLLGHNGAGKTTIMRMLTGFLEPTSGSIRIERARDRPGYRGHPAPHRLSARELPGLAGDDASRIPGIPGGAARRVAERGARRRSPAAIRRTELRDQATQSIQTLSRGYRQRVGVAQAILHDPDIIILDEPTNGLDPTQILHMRALIRELSRTATVIVSTHILQEVQAVCERVLILRAGRKVHRCAAR